MAERRMFSKTITESDAFLDMPLSTQALYFHLGMLADDDGFINSPKKIQRMLGASDDDFKVLLSKRFILLFESGIIVIKHWKINNYIQKDRYKGSLYQQEKEQLFLKENKAYTFDKNKGVSLCIQDVSKMDTQFSLGKVSNKLNYTKLNHYYLYIIEKESNFDDGKSAQEKNNEKLVVIRTLRKLDLLIEAHVDRVLTEEKRRELILQYWAVKELCESRYRVYIKYLTRDMFLNKFLKVREYLKIEKFEEFLRYFIKSLENELKLVEQQKVLSN